MLRARPLHHFFALVVFEPAIGVSDLGAVHRVDDGSRGRGRRIEGLRAKRHRDERNSSSQEQSFHTVGKIIRDDCGDE